MILKLPTKQRGCDCAMCKRGRKFYRITGKLPKAEREWMRGFYDAVMESENDLEMLRMRTRRVK